MRQTALAALVCCCPALAQQDAAPAPSLGIAADQLSALEWRNLGPTNMGGRITNVEVVPQTPWVWFVATGGGGLWRTTNAGTTWTPVFDHYPTASIGDVAIAPSDPDVVWVGTGEENARNSVQWGDGVYKSTDGGDTFRHMGLAASFQIGHIAIHPTDADVVFVAALGRLWGRNPERGLFRTRDGGDTWEHVLAIDDRTGCIDVRIDPQNPRVVYAVSYERWRDEFDSNDPAQRFGDGSGLWRSDDGGDHWQRLSDGLPTCRWGRAGIDLYAANPATVFAIIETERSGWADGERRSPPDEEDADADRGYVGVLGGDGAPGARLDLVTKGGPAAQAGLASGDVIVRIGDDEIGSWEDAAEQFGASTAGDRATLVVRRGEQQLEVELTYGERPGLRRRGPPSTAPGGPNAGRLGGQNANVQDSQGERGFETGGVFRSDDRGQTWRRLNSLTERPFYYSVIRVDPRDDQRLYSVGVQLYGSHDGGSDFQPINRGIHVDFHDVWIDPTSSGHLLAACDGGLNETRDGGRTWEIVDNLPIGQFYHAGVDQSVPYRVFGGLQDNGTWGGPSRTSFREGITAADWFKIYSGDGFRAHADPLDPDTVYATSQNGNIGRVDLRTGRSTRVDRPRGAGAFNWDTPFFLSPHNSRVLYFAGAHAHRSVDRGGASRQLTSDPLGLSARGTATAMAESPVEAGVLFVGTDDGALWRSVDDGRQWEELHARLPHAGGPRYVSSITASAHDADRVYVTLDGHRSDDFSSHVYVSGDRGATWQSLADTLPDAPCHILVEDPTREDLLFLGTEFGCWVSLDRGAAWLPLGSKLPTVAVRDLAIQDRDADLVAATHGRGLWVVDIAPLRQLDAEVAAEDIHLLTPAPAILWRTRSRSLTGNRDWRASNPPAGATIYLWLRATPSAAPTVEILDIEGQSLARLEGAASAGLQRLQWDPSGRSGGRRRGRSPGPRPAPATPGSYTAVLRLDDFEQRRAIVLLPDPTTSLDAERAETPR